METEPATILRVSIVVESDFIEIRILRKLFAVCAFEKNTKKAKNNMKNMRLMLNLFTKIRLNYCYTKQRK